MKSSARKYAIEIRDTKGTLTSIIHDKALPRFEYNRIGGCGRCSIDLNILYDSPIVLRADYDVQIFLENAKGGRDLWYRGYLDSYKPVLSTKERITLTISGYVGQLKRIRVQRMYENREISLIIKDILEKDVFPNTAITNVLKDIESTNFSVDRIEFDTMADDAIKTLAELAGRMEWGVDRNKVFFFKREQDSISHYLRVGVDISVLDNYIDFGAVINKLHIKGGKVSSVPFVDTVANHESQQVYGLREKILSNASIVSTSVSQRYGTMLLLESARAQRKASLRVRLNTKLYEEQIPLGMVSIISDKEIHAGKRYGDPESIYGTFLYGGNLWSSQINKIHYTITDYGTDVSIAVAQARPSIADQIKLLEYEINQIRSI